MQNAVRNIPTGQLVLSYESFIAATKSAVLCGDVCPHLGLFGASSPASASYWQCIRCQLLTLMHKTPRGGTTWALPRYRTYGLTLSTATTIRAAPLQLKPSGVSVLPGRASQATLLSPPGTTSSSCLAPMMHLCCRITGKTAKEPPSSPSSWRLVKDQARSPLPETSTWLRWHIFT